ncbi:hypothetical protein [Streptomyces yanii]|uniref:Uncharacterized protein n=1 Tax=Streptomyces yanii TaxID=78510 RepID=A0ABV5QZR4_9ACTN
MAGQEPRIDRSAMIKVADSPMGDGPVLRERAPAGRVQRRRSAEPSDKLPQVRRDPSIPENQVCGTPIPRVPPSRI